MTQLSFGSILQSERERKGYDISSVARRLRIRPDILQAIEASDFSRMPSRGYARNMVNAYARYLGLNPTEITRMYLDEAYADQVRKARSNAQPTGFDMSGAVSSRRNATSRRDAIDSERDSVTRDGRVLLVDSNTSRYRNPENEHLYSEERTHRSTRSAVPGTQYTNFYAGPKAPGSVRSKLPLIIAGVVILALIIVLLVFFFGPKGESGDEILPVTGVDNTTQNDGTTTPDDTTAQQEPVPVAPTDVEVAYVVESGQSAYIEVYFNDAIQEAGYVEGGTSEGEKRYDVTGKIRIVTTNVAAVKVYQDGVEVPFSDDGGGIYSITIDFAVILDQWKAANVTPTDTPTDSTS